MEKIVAGDPETRSADVVADNLERLKTLFPEAFSERRVDFEVLRQLLARLRLGPTRHARRPFLARASRAPSTRRSLVPSRWKPRSKTWLNCADRRGSRCPGDAVDEREENYGLNWHGKRRARQLALTPSTGTLRPCTEDSVDWDTTQNLVIEGDNLEVLKLLQKSYAGKVKLIYIDTPYNTGKDFIYPDNYHDNIGHYLRLTGQADNQNRKISSNTELSGRFHTDWMSMMYPRLRLARTLCRPDGAIFITIDWRRQDEPRRDSQAARPRQRAEPVRL